MQFGKKLCNPHLYNLMISSQADEGVQPQK